MNLNLRRSIQISMLGLLAGTLTLALHGQQPQSVTQGVYSDAQAMRGLTIYNARCASCHGANLVGRTGPALAGDDFNGIWARKSLADLLNKIVNTMPKDDTKRLSRQESADLVAYMLQSDKLPAGRTDLQTDEAALKQIAFPAMAVSAPQANPGATAQFPPVGNLAQVMRGILFPSSNIIFTTQSIDPGAKKPVTDSNTAVSGGFDWLTWGGNVYKGWDLVDYASVAVGESAVLMLTPGRRCENGKLVPVNDPDWQKFTAELAEAGRAAYKASQTRTQAIAAESTNQLNDSCEHCHRVYRSRVHCVK